MTDNHIADAQAQLDRIVRQAYAAAFPEKELRDFVIEIPKDTSHGDFATNVAMVNTKNVGRAPRDIAAALIEAMDFSGSFFTGAESAGPGFINFRLGPAVVFRGGAGSAGLRQGLRAFGCRRRQKGDGGVRLRQPHRPDAHGQRPGRRHRRLPGGCAGLCRV